MTLPTKQKKLFRIGETARQALNFKSIVCESLGFSTYLGTYNVTLSAQNGMNCVRIADADEYETVFEVLSTYLW